MNRNILLTLSYDGTNFCGWQRQDPADRGHPVRTVQGELEAALEGLHHQPVAVSGSGRTDSGVHAARQGANFFSPIHSIPVENYVPALNSLLPRDIRVHQSSLVSPDFHARFSALSRTYRYVLYCGKSPPAYEAPYVWALGRCPGIQRLNAMAACLSGELDCAAFSAAGDQSRSKCRYIEKAVFFPVGNSLVFEIRANAFLWKMVRSLVGTLLDCENAGQDAGYFKEILESRDRRRAGITAPAQGLFLWHIAYRWTEKKEQTA
jgi:tRNA pseudouridine38-40 synthase